MCFINTKNINLTEFSVGGFSDFFDDFLQMGAKKLPLTVFFYPTRLSFCLSNDNKEKMWYRFYVIFIVS